EPRSSDAGRRPPVMPSKKPGVNSFAWPPDELVPPWVESSVFAERRCSPLLLATLPRFEKLELPAAAPFSSEQPKAPPVKKMPAIVRIAIFVLMLMGASRSLWLPETYLRKVGAKRAGGVFSLFPQ